MYVLTVHIIYENQEKSKATSLRSGIKTNLQVPVNEPSLNGQGEGLPSIIL